MAKASVLSSLGIVKLLAACALAVCALAGPAALLSAQEEPAPAEQPPEEQPAEQPAEEQPPAEQPPEEQPPAEQPAETPTEKPKASGASAPVDPEEWLELTLPENMDIRVFVELVGQKLQLKFIYDEQLTGAITIQPNQRVQVKELYGMLETALSFKNQSMVRAGDWVRIMPMHRAPTMTPIPLPDQIAPPEAGDSTVTEMIRLQFVDPRDIQDALTPFLSDFGNVFPMPDRGMVIITEFRSRLDELRRIISLLDVRQKKLSKRVKDLKYAKAPEVATRLLNILASRVQARTKTVPIKQPVGTATRIVYQVVAAPPEQQPFIDVNEHTNSLVLIGVDSDLDELEELIDIYDVARKELHEVRIYELVYLSATDAMRSLMEIGLAGMEFAVTPVVRRPARAPTGQPQPQPQPAAAAATGGTGAVPRLSVLEARNALIVSATPEEQERIAKFLDDADKKRKEMGNIRNYVVKRRKPDDVAELLKNVFKSDQVDPRTKTPIPGEEGAPRIVASKETGSILVNANATQHEEIARIIADLDARQPQVLLECTLIEVTDRDNVDIGVELENLTISGKAAANDRMFNTTQFNFSARDPVTGLRVLSGQGLAPVSGAGTTGATVAFLEDNIVVALIRALETKSKGRVLSKPRILVNNNYEGAVIESVDEEPVTQLDALTSNVTTVTFKEYVKAGTKLTITPQISDGDFLKLKIDVEVGTFTGPAQGTNVPPPKATRTLGTEITVPDQRTIVIGGLMGKRQLETVDQVPILGDIPILGEVFKHRVKSDVATTIYLFVKASILRDVSFQDLSEETQQAREVMPVDLQKLDPSLTTEAAKKEAARLNEILRRREMERQMELELRRLEVEGKKEEEPRAPAPSQEPVVEPPAREPPAEPEKPAPGAETEKPEATAPAPAAPRKREPPVFAPAPIIVPMPSR